MNKIERNMRIRSQILQGFVVMDGDMQFATDVLSILPGTVDLGEIEKLRHSNLDAKEIVRLRTESISADLRPYLWHCTPSWKTTDLQKLQMSTKPISGRFFCLTALAFIWDAGVDLRAARLHAIVMGLHRRSKSNLAKLDRGVLLAILHKSLY